MKSALRNRLSALAERRIRAERRAGKRMVPAQRTLCLLQAADADEPAMGVVQNLSCKGVGVVAEREFSFGVQLSIRLVNASHTFSVVRGLKVVRCIRLADNRCLLAGPFDRILGHDEVVPFLI